MIAYGTAVRGEGHHGSGRHRIAKSVGDKSRDLVFQPERHATRDVIELACQTEIPLRGRAAQHLHGRRPCHQRRLHRENLGGHLQGQRPTARGDDRSHESIAIAHLLARAQTLARNLGQRENHGHARQWQAATALHPEREGGLLRQPGAAHTQGRSRGADKFQCSRLVTLAWRGCGGAGHVDHGNVEIAQSDSSSGDPQRDVPTRCARRDDQSSCGFTIGVGQCGSIDGPHVHGETNAHILHWLIELIDCSHFHRRSPVVAVVDLNPERTHHSTEPADCPRKREHLAVDAVGHAA